MEDVSRDESVISATSLKSKLRYPLRSANKMKEEKTENQDALKSSASKKAKPASIVSQSMNVLNLSGKDKSTKPPRRLSNPTKPHVTPNTKTSGYITPISEIRSKRSVNSQSNTPYSDLSKSVNTKRFCTLSSASYWLSQIKLSESAAKHSISLSFFKLALEAGCEPIQRMRDELKSYARRHNLTEHEELVQQMFNSYNISENSDQSQVSETISQVPEHTTRSSDDDDVQSSSIIGVGKLKPKSLNVDALHQTPKVVESAKKENIQKTNNSSTKAKGPVKKNSAVKKSGTTQKATKQEIKKEKIKKQGKQGTCEEAKPSLVPVEEIIEENKENMDAPSLESVSSVEATIQT